VSRAVLLAALAGALAGPALADVARLVRARPRRRAHANGSVRALARIGRGAGAPKAAADLGGRLAAAGTPLGLSPEDVVAVKAGCALAGVVGMAPLLAAGAGRLGVLLLVSGPIAAFLAPDLWLRRRARRRGHEVERALPDTLELLRVALDAGLPLTRALAEVGRRRRGLLAAELRRVAREIELGTPRAQALDALAGRCHASGMPVLVAAILRAERLGSPLAATLAAQAKDARAARAARIR
jgi:tight adherence protein C